MVILHAGNAAQRREARTPVAVSGSNQTQVGIYNECLLLDGVRRTPGIAATQLARRTGLSAQTVTGAVNRLLAAGLLTKEARQQTRRIGQPAVPLRVRADGAFALGAKIGRAASETMLVDFGGAVCAHDRVAHKYPDPEKLLPWMRAKFAEYRGTLPDEGRLLGAGVATFFGVGGWRDIFPMPKRAVAGWEQADIAGALAPAVGAPIWLINDASAACLAEVELGDSSDGENMLYFHLGTFVGGGVAINRRVFFGSNGNAGALASMPIGARQLIHNVSLYALKKSLQQRQISWAQVEAERLPAARARTAARVFAAWRRQAAGALAKAIAAATAVMDFSEVVIDGALPATERAALLAAVDSALTRRLMIGMVRPRLLAGGQGRRASCLGAAWAPIYLKFSPAQTLLLKTPPVVAI